MSLTPTIYQSTDAGAPQLTGQVGALINLLRAVLVTGYGSGGGAKAALGWTEEFTATNKAVFRNNPVSGTGYRLRVMDDGTAAAGGDARSASVRAYSTMSSIDEGTDPTPTAAQYANGAIWPKSTIANATVRAWWLIGNERCFYLFIDVGGTGLKNASPFFAGDINSFKPGDGHSFVLSVSVASWGGSGVASRIFCATLSALSSGGAPSGSVQGMVIGRSYTGALGATYIAPSPLKAIGSPSTPLGGSGLPFPSPISGGMFYDIVVVHEANTGPRGSMPGLYVPLHQRPYPDLDEISGLDGLPLGRVLVSKQFRGDSLTSSGGDGALLFDRVGAW